MMNDEYLWNKTGSDAEVEGLENALKAFRYRENDALRVLVQPSPSPDRKSHRIWRLGFAFAFAAAVVVVLSGALFMWRDNSSATYNALSSVPIQDLPLADIPVIETTAAIKNPQPKKDKEFVKIRRTGRSAIQPVRPVAKRSPNEHPQVQLTAEEKYAYDQLILALSITSSKLKIVKDTVSQIDKPDTAVERYR